MSRQFISLFMVMIVVAALLVPAASLVEANSNEITSHTDTIQVDSGTFKVNYIKIPKQSNRVEFRATTAKGKVGYSDSLENLTKQENGIAAINGTFFDAYTSTENERFTSGTIMVNGRMLSTTSFGSTIGINEENELDIVRGKIRTLGYINGVYKWYAWRLNHPSSDPNSIILFTPEFSLKTISLPGTKVVVNKSHVINITNETVPIPANGYVILFGTAEYPQRLAKEFQLEDEVTYDFEIESPDKSEDEFLNLYQQMIGAGPKLLTDGVPDVDLVKDKMTGEKHSSIRSSRSFIGYNDNFVIMGTTFGALHTDVAHIAKKFGLQEAMALDGGASSGLYFNGGYLTRPGRNVSNAIVVRYLEGPPIYINQERLYLDSNPFIESGTSMVPLRGIFEKLDAKVSWNGTNKSITINNDQQMIVMSVNSKKATVNGKSVELVKAPQLKNNRAHIPLRFVAEALGAYVNWDSEHYKIDIVTAE